jgi:multicomponent Na+:H+ antiporter subunit E
MKNLSLTLLLALVWTAVQGTFTLGNFAVGFVLAYVVLRLMRPLIGEAGYDRRLGHRVALVGFFVKELVVSNIRVAAEVLTPGYSMRAGILAVPLSVRSDAGITLFANLISLTPGTLSLDVSEEEEDVMHLKRTLERRVILALGEEATEAPPPEEASAL